MPIATRPDDRRHQSAAILKAKYGPDYYKNLGKKGGSAKHKFRYFRDVPGAAREAGYIGGCISRREK